MLHFGLRAGSAAYPMKSCPSMRFRNAGVVEFRCEWQLQEQPVWQATTYGVTRMPSPSELEDFVEMGFGDGEDRRRRGYGN